MAERYYVDTSIWMDLYEYRRGYDGEPLGDFALRLLGRIRAEQDVLVVTDLLFKELKANYSLEEVMRIFKPFEGIIEKVPITRAQCDEAWAIAKERGIPEGDVLHAVVSRDNSLILVTRDNHFRALEDVCRHYKPEELI